MTRPCCVVECPACGGTSRLHGSDSFPTGTCNPCQGNGWLGIEAMAVLYQTSRAAAERRRKRLSHERREHRREMDRFVEDFDDENELAAKYHAKCVAERAAGRRITELKAQIARLEAQLALQTAA